MQLQKASVPLLSLALAACEVFQTPLPATKTVLEKQPVVSNSKSFPCWHQREVAAMRSYNETIITGKEVVYVAPSEKCRKNV